MNTSTKHQFIKELWFSTLFNIVVQHTKEQKMAAHQPKRCRLPWLAESVHARVERERFFKLGLLFNTAQVLYGLSLDLCLEDEKSAMMLSLCTCRVCIESPNIQALSDYQNSFNLLKRTSS